jgi:transcriptional regulator of arginine metabolism
MATRARRQHCILRAIEARNPGSQHELQEMLAAEGIEATQATLSRDLRALGVSKGPRGYMLAPQQEAVERNGRSLERALQQELLSADHGGNTVVLRTRPGHANPLAVEIDHARLKHVLGTVAGDDTVLVVTRTAPQAKALASRLRARAGHH